MYLLYTIYEADWDIRRASDFYQDLGVPHNASERDVKSAFRRLAARFHPDKAPSTTSVSEGYFVHLKQAQDVLVDPVKRFAYERFGPDITLWQRCSSIREFLAYGIQTIIPYYGVAAIFMYVLGILGFLEWGKYWRWLILVVLFVFELHTISRPYFPPIAAKFINPLFTAFTSHPPYLPFQLVQLARKISITVYIAFSQIGPILQSPDMMLRHSDPDAALRQQVDRLETVVKAADVEVTRLVDMEKAPFIGDPQALNEVQGKVKEWLVQNTIRNDPEVRDAMGRLFKRRRVYAPAGARGNR